MEFVGVVFEVFRFLWIAFLVAAPVAIWLMASGQVRLASNLVFGEIVLILALGFVGMIAGSASGSHGAGWDMLGIFYWSLYALLVAAGTGAIILLIFVARKALGAREQ